MACSSETESPSLPKVRVGRIPSEGGAAVAGSAVGLLGGSSVSGDWLLAGICPKLNTNSAIGNNAIGKRLTRVTLNKLNKNNLNKIEVDKELEVGELG
jgi:hypothetical protein